MQDSFVFESDSGPCPACGVTTKEWKKPIISTAVAGLCRLVALYQGKPMHYDDFTVLAKDRNFSQLVLWGLVEAGDYDGEQKRSAGTWSPTEKGIMFVHGHIEIPSHVVTFDNRLIGFAGKPMNVCQALREKFHYGDLMKENFYV